MKFPNYIYSEIIKLCLLIKPVFNSEYYDQNYNNVRQKHMLSLALVSKKWFKYSSICKFKLNAKEIYEYIFNQENRNLPINYTREISFDISQYYNINNNSIIIISPPLFSLVDFNNITMVNFYNINRDAQKLLLLSSSPLFILKLFKHLEFIIDGVNTLLELDLFSILSQYKSITNQETNIRLILNLYASCGSFSFDKLNDLQIYKLLKVHILTITTDHMINISDDLLELIYLLDPEYLAFNSLYNGSLKLNSTVSLIRKGNCLISSLIDIFKLEKLNHLECESFSELSISNNNNNNDDDHIINTVSEITIQELKESIINNKSIKKLSIKINKDKNNNQNKNSINRNNYLPIYIIDFFSTIFKFNSTITSLSLSGFTFLEFIPNFYESLKTNQTIQSLSLTNGSLVNSGQFDSLYQVVLLNTNIINLNIQNNKITLNEETIKRFINLPTLKTLTLSNNTFNKIVIKHYNENPLLELII